MTMKDVKRIHVVALFAVLGCGDPGTVYEVYPGQCRERCVDGRIYDLSSIDHAQPSEGSMRALDESCRESSEPCCRRVGASFWARGMINGPTTCIPGQFVPIDHPTTREDPAK